MARPQGPGIATASRRRGGDFLALIGRVADDSDALDGLLYAYESLDVGGRERLARAVLQDVEEPHGVLSLLFTIEEDPGVRRLLFAWLAAQPGAEPWVALDGTAEAGEAYLIRPGLGERAEAMRVRWDHGEIRRIDVELLDDSSSYRATHVPTEDAAELLAPMVWRFLRAGRVLPDGAHRFAGFFVASPRV